MYYSIFDLVVDVFALAVSTFAMVMDNFEVENRKTLWKFSKTMI